VLTIVMAKVIARVIGKERVNAFFSQISGTVPPGAGTNGHVGQLETASIVTIATLQIANNQLSSTAMVCKVRKRFHG